MEGKNGEGLGTRLHKPDAKTLILVSMLLAVSGVMSKSAIKILWDPTVPWDRWDYPWESTVPP